MTSDLVLTYYGDDFTGSTDVMEQLEAGGVSTVLFLDVPTAEQLKAFPNIRAVGIAGTSRAMTPRQMNNELPGKFKALSALEAPFFHYKVCSTFDSSPDIGSIGHAIDIGWQIFDPAFVPLIIGAPFLRRYVAFGNLFARVDETTYRLDRHPTMRHHPITPMTEADLRLHLGQQTSRQVGLLDYWHMTSKSLGELNDHLSARRQMGDQIMVFDTLNDAHLRIIGQLLWERRGERPIFVVGSSGVERALVLHMQSDTAAQKSTFQDASGPAQQVIVMSGSAAPGTHEQILDAVDQGFIDIQLDVPALIDPAKASAQRNSIIEEALTALEAGRSVVLYTALGSQDPMLQMTHDRAEALNILPHTVGERLGEQQGIITRRLIEASNVRRVCIAGGDTSGHVSHQLGIFALRAIQRIAPGAPLCRAYSSQPLIDGLEISLKGGQNGGKHYFTNVLQGGTVD